MPRFTFPSSTGGTGGTEGTSAGGTAGAGGETSDGGEQSTACAKAAAFFSSASCSAGFDAANCAALTPACAKTFGDLIDCVSPNAAQCTCENGGTKLNCDAVTDAAESPCYAGANAFNACKDDK